MELIRPQIIGVSKSPESMQVTWGQTVGRILNQNEIDRKDSDDNWKQDKDIKLVGRIPRSIWMLWQEAGITDDEAALERALERNPEYKTTEKRLI